MASRTVYDCDVCEKKHIDSGSRVAVYVDRRMDAAGSMDDEWQDIDLCNECKAEAFDRLVSWANEQHGRMTLDGKTILKAARGKP